MTLKRILGAEMLLVGLLSLAFCVLGAIYGARMIERVGRGLDGSLSLASQSLDTAVESLLLAKMTLGEVNDGLETVETTLVDVSQAMSQTRPLLADLGQVVSHDVPNGIEASQAAMSEMAQVAAAVDQTLATLSDLRIEESILGAPIRFELNLGYSTEVPFEESVNRVGSSLEGIPSQLRGLAVHVDTADGNLHMISQDLLAVSSDLDAISGRAAEVAPLLDRYARIVTEANDLVQQARAGLSRRLLRAKLAVTMAMVWLSLMQVAPLYLGWELASGRRGARRLPSH
jgi:hypothetical protein